MAERDMTGRERGELETDTTADLSPAADGSELSGGIGRAGAPAGLGGDLANLPPWSARAGRARPDRDPVALAAWRRVAELRRRRDDDAPASDVPGPASSPEAEPAPAPEAEPTPEPATDGVAPSILGFGTPAVAGSPDDEAGDPVDVDEVDVDVEEVDVEEVDVDPVEVDAAAPEPRDHDGDPVDRRPAPNRPAGTAAGYRPAEAGAPERSGRGAGEGSGGRHEVLLGLAGRLDDDALSSVRELVAVEDDAAAAELLGGALLAAGVGLTARELGVLGGWFSAARVDPELVDALPEDADADRRGEHRFVADPPGTPAGDGPGEVIARAVSRLPGVRHVRQCWRTTPAGAAPGPVPHRVLLVETHTADDCEHVAHHVAHAARDLGAVSVEVFATDADLPAYHRAAVASARPLDAAAPATPTAAPPATPPSPPPAPSPAVPMSARPATAAAPLPARRRSAPVVPPFGVGAPGDTPRTPEPDEDVFRTVADAGRTVDVPGTDRDEPVEDRTVADPPDGVAPAVPAEDPLLDPETTAERIAALWRRPVGEDALGAADPPAAEAGRYRPIEPDPPDPYTESYLDSFVAPYPEVEPPWYPGGHDVDPSATTGDIPVPVAPPRPGTNGHSLAGPAREAPAPDAGDDRARIRRARHSRGGEDETPPTPSTNGHHGPSGRVDDPATEPVARPDAPAAAPETAPPRPSSIDDSVDSQLSDRERELLARLHDELASRERLEAGTPDPLLGRRPPDGPRPRPHPGGGRPAPPPAGPVNGHDLPRWQDPRPGDG